MLELYWREKRVASIQQQHEALSFYMTTSEGLFLRDLNPSSQRRELIHRSFVKSQPIKRQCLYCAQLLLPLRFLSLGIPAIEYNFSKFRSQTSGAGAIEFYSLETFNDSFLQFSCIVGKGYLENFV